MVFFILTGVSLRLWNWSSQILLDDEWHALNFVLTRSFRDVFLQQGLGANSIPINVYSWIVLHTTGWSEPLLRLPSMVSGIAALFVIPLLVKRIWGHSVACVTTALLAISPIAIFYCRIMRPYAPVMFLAMSSILFTLIWMKEGKRRDLMFSALFGSFAIYYHLYAAIPVGVPLIVAFIASLRFVGPRLGLTLGSKRPFTDVLWAGCVMVVLDGALVVFPNVLNPWWMHGIHNIDRATMDTLVTVLRLISGTRNPFLVAIAIGLLLIGLIVMVVKSRTIGVAITLSFALFSAVMATTTQDGAHAGIQVARYGITFIPLSFVAIAVALVWVGETLRTKYTLFQRKYLLCSVGVLVWLPYIVTSPLWTTYAYPNSFTSHSAYQYRYEQIQWLQRSPERDLIPGISMEYGRIPQFYLKSPLISAAKGIIEYPMLIGDQLNLFYYYQHFHHRPVVAGFVANNKFAPIVPGRDFVIGDWPIDSVMTGIPESLRKKSSWKAMVDLNDSETLRSRYKGWIIIIHRDLMNEINRFKPIDDRMSFEQANVMTKIFGAPLLFDDQLAVWMID